MNRLEGKVVVITGAAQGIGAAYALGMASQGAKVVVSDIADTSNIVEQIKTAGGNAIGCHTDVTDNDSLAALVNEAEEAFGPIEILINNAAVFTTLKLKPFTEISENEWDAVMRVNVRGPFQCAKAIVPSMRKNGRGKIINISSGTFLRGAPMFCHYVSSKGAIVGQTRALAAELGADSIHVNCIIVGLTESEGVKQHEQMSKITSPTLQSRIIKRSMLPNDLLGAIYFFSSEDSDFVTGQCVNVDGGALNY